MARRSTKIKGLNQHQKAARRLGPHRVRAAEVERYLALVDSGEAEERCEAAANLCPCHVRHPDERVEKAIYRLMQDSDVQVRRRAWHTIEDGGLPDTPQMQSLLLWALENEKDSWIRDLLRPYFREIQARQRQADRLAARPTYDQRTKCDFCGQVNVSTRADYQTEIPTFDGKRAARICRQCDNR